MLNLQCIQTILIGLGIVVLMLSLKNLMNRLSLTFWKHILLTMKLRNYRLVTFICSCLTLSTFTIAVNNIRTSIVNVEE
jgi:hypothetical protein